jgi:hypothetical protein
MPVSTNLTVQFQDALQQIYQSEVKSLSNSDNLTDSPSSATATGVQSNTSTSTLRQRAAETPVKDATEWQHLLNTIQRNKSNNMNNWQPDRDKMDSFMLEAYRVVSTNTYLLLMNFINS